MSANTLYVLLDNGCSIRVYQSFVTTFPIILALCSMLSVIYYAPNHIACVIIALVAVPLIPNHTVIVVVLVLVLLITGEGSQACYPIKYKIKLINIIHNIVTIIM